MISAAIHKNFRRITMISMLVVVIILLILLFLVGFYFTPNNMELVKGSQEEMLYLKSWELLLVIAFIQLIMLIGVFYYAYFHLHRGYNDEKKKFSLITEETVDGYCLLDDNLKILETNKSLADMLGYTSNELTGKFIDIFMSPADGSELRKKIAPGELSDSRYAFPGYGMHYSAEIMMYSNHGEPVYVIFKTTRIYNQKNNRSYLFTYITNITDNYQAKEMARESETKLEKLIYNLGVIVCKRKNDENKTIEALDDTITELTGYPAEDFINNQIRPFISVIHEEDVNNFLHVINKAAAEGQDYVTEYRIITAGGEIIRVRELGRPVEYGQNQLKWLDGIIIDITKQKLADEYAKTISDNNIILENTRRELTAAQKAAERAINTRNEFLATISHEIRTPMNGIIGMTEILIDTILSPQQREYAEVIRESSDLLLNIINDILDYSKIEAGRMELNILDFNLKPLFNQVHGLMKPKVSDKDVKFSVSVSDLIPEVLYGDPFRLRQILFNLTGNAIKFTEKGHISLRALPVEINDEEVLIRFEVEDTGAGIAKNALARIFEPFVQADSSTTREYSGTGLGLVICRRLADMMNGVIDVVSEEGKGSTFWLMVPFKRNMPETDTPPDPSIKVLPYKENLTIPAWLLNKAVMIAEDNHVNKRIAAIQLKKLGFKEVVLANNGIEALKKAKEKNYGLILMDCRMPVMDGYDATKAIRKWEKEKNQYTPVIAMTGHAMEADREKCISVGMDDYIGKPVRLETLNNVIAALFQDKL